MIALRVGQVHKRVWAAAPLLAGDLMLTAAAWAGALLLRYDGDVPAEAWPGLVRFLPIVLVLTLAAYAAVGLYSGLLRFASVLEARQIVIAQVIVAAVLLPLVVLLGRPVPLSVPVVATVLGCGLAGAVRFWSRLLRWQAVTGRAQHDTERLLVIGAGEVGVALVRDVQTHHSAQVVGLVDDQPRLRGRRALGVPVLGSIDQLADIVEATAATRAVLAIAHADATLVRRVATLCGDELGIGLSIVPSASELVGRQVSLQDVRDIEIADLLGRPQVDTDLEDVRDLISGKRVLVTGGGGSIGAELARQISAFAPASLTLLDHDETHLFDAVAGIPVEVRQRLADIRDVNALAKAFEQERPELVFHAAALKHVPILETHPVQAVHTNLLGTRNVIECAERVGVERFVFISTDKAVRPSSVMGRTKLAGEHLVLGRASAMTSCAVRFGNVLGSRGSVVPTFVRQIREGGPVTVTDGRMTRYFMSIPEAVRLVLHAAALSSGREIFMLDMGEPVRILDLARRMIQLSGQRPGVDVEIRVTAIRPGEKLAEELHSPDEQQHATTHPSIVRLEPVHVDGPVMQSALTQAQHAATQQDPAAARRALALVVDARHTSVAAPTTPSHAQEALAWN